MKVHMLSPKDPELLMCGEPAQASRTTKFLLEISCRGCRKTYERDAKKQRRREKRHD